jgi:hypothetical protein
MPVFNNDMYVFSKDRRVRTACEGHRRTPEDNIKIKIREI